MRRDFNPVRRARPVEGASAGIFTGQVLRTLLGAHHVRPAPFSQADPLLGRRWGTAESQAVLSRGGLGVWRQDPKVPALPRE